MVSTFRTVRGIVHIIVVESQILIMFAVWTLMTLPRKSKEKLYSLSKFLCLHICFSLLTLLQGEWPGRVSSLGLSPHCGGWGWGWCWPRICPQRFILWTPSFAVSVIYSIYSLYTDRCFAGSLRLTMASIPLSHSLWQRLCLGILRSTTSARSEQVQVSIQLVWFWVFL